MVAGGNVSVAESVIAFAKEVMTLAYVGCKTSIFNNPDQKIYTMNAKITRIREVMAGGAVDYDGKFEVAGGDNTIKWKDYQANIDRFKNITIDIVDEMATYETAMTPSVVALVKDFLNRVLSGEIDAYCISSWYSEVPTVNVLYSDDASLSGKSAFEQLDVISQKQLDAGVDINQEVVAFVNPDKYFEMRKFALSNAGLANGAVLSKRTRELNMDNEGLTGALEYSTDVIRYNNFTIVPLPANRMQTAIVLYDGKTEGQTAGGFAPDETSKEIQLLCMPIDSGFMDVKYFVANFFLPRLAANMNQSIEMDAGVKKVIGDVVFQNVGINQKGDNFEADLRVIYNAELFDIRKKTVFAVVKK